MAQTTLVSSIDRSETYPKLVSVSAPYCCGTLILKPDSSFTEQMLHELPTVTVNIYVLVDDEYTIWDSRALSVSLQEAELSNNGILIDIPTTCMFGITPNFDNFAVESHNEGILVNGGEVWTKTDTFPLEVIWDNTNIYAEESGGGGTGDIRIDDVSIVAENKANIITTGSEPNEDAYDSDSESTSFNPLATQKFVEKAISGIAGPMTFKGSATITADSIDTTKCSISVSDPLVTTDIKRGFTYKITSIASSPVYTGPLKIGDVVIACKDAPVVTTSWVVDTDWTVVPSGDEEGKIYYAAEGGGLQLTGAESNEFGHSNTPTSPQADLGVYKVKHDALGHITESAATSVVEVVTGLVTAAPDESAPPNNLTYTTYANERLTFHQIGYNTNNTIVSTITPPPPIVTREVDFVNNTKSITGNVSNLQVYQNMGRCNVADDGTINAYYGEAGYTEDGSNGQVMVKVPKFYYKLDVSQTGDLEGVNIRKGRWSIADVKVDNTWKLHPAFLAADGVTELDYFMYGAFDAVGQDSNGTYSTSYNTTSYKLGSVGGNIYAPSNNFTRATVRTMATNRGIGWYSAGVKQTMAVLMLFAVEYGFNSQLAVGWGVVSDSAAHKTGQTTGNTTSGTRDNKTTCVNYRGIENLWGNIWNWIDGINFNSTTPYVCDTFNFVDDTSTGYTQIAFNLPSTNYITAFGYDSNNDWILLPSESSSSANIDGPIGDYVYSSSGWRVAPLGCHWVGDTYAGAFYWLCYYTFYADSSVSARLMYIPQTT